MRSPRFKAIKAMHMISTDPSELKGKYGTGQGQGKDRARLAVDFVFEAPLGSLWRSITDAYNAQYLFLMILTRSEIIYIERATRLGERALPRYPTEKPDRCYTSHPGWEVGDIYEV